VKTGKRQSASKASAVPGKAKRDAEAQQRDWSWVEATIWTERMLAALENGVKGGKWIISDGRMLSSLRTGFSP